VSDIEQFQADRRAEVAAMRSDTRLQAQALDLVDASMPHRYTYHFDWLGLPIIQLPTDMVALQEILWNVKPRVVVETGVARGGSLAFSASILQLLGGDGIVVGIDIDIRDHNRKAIEAHPLADRIVLVEGSSVDPGVVEAVHGHAADRQPAVVILDSLHTHDHVLAELRAYSNLVHEGSYLIVFDTTIEDLPPDRFPDRPWGVGDNPMTAVAAFLEESDGFVIDEDVDAKLLLTAARRGYLRCVR